MARQQFIPDEAPFTEEQRAWLNDFFTRAFPNMVPPPPPAAGSSASATILWGSQTGNAEGLAARMHKALKSAGVQAKCYDMAEYDQSHLTGEEYLLIITSTYGDGEPPDNAEDFYEWIRGEEAPKLDSLKYAVLGLGDTEYPDFCECGKVLDARLEELGAERIYDRVDCDVEYEEPFAKWKKGIIATLGRTAPTPAVAQATEAHEEEGFSKRNPFPSQVLENRNLNGTGSPKRTHHIALSLKGSDLEYEVGDALGVYPRNPESVVDEMLDALPFNTNIEVPLPDGGEAPLRQALLEHYDLRSINRKFLEMWGSRSGSPYLRALLEGANDEQINDFLWGRELIDLIVDYPADFRDGEEFVSELKRLQPRLYSIASSPRAHPGEVHLTVGVVEYKSHGRQRGGVCSTYLADRLSQDPPHVYIQPNKSFRLPAEGTTDIIMVGPGTGIAPFRAFLEDRHAQKAQGRNWLFFGNPYQETDYLYQQELESMHQSGLLHRLDTAFSRDQAHKIYVQDRMIEAGAEIWNWLEAGAHFYVCGDASRMAKDVDTALHTIAQQHGKLSPEQAAESIKQLKKAKRYLRDVY